MRRKRTRKSRNKIIQELHRKPLNANANEVPEKESQLLFQSLFQQQFHHIVRFGRDFWELEQYALLVL